MRILIDGYNLLAATDLRDRDSLIAALARYRRRKQHPVTVVFDGMHGGSGLENRSLEQGVEVVFSPLTVSADDVIERLLLGKDAASWIVVTSDRRIQSAAVRAGTAFMPSEEFAARLSRTTRSASQPGDHPALPPWLEGRSESDARPSPAKRGRARHLTKKEKRRRKRLEKI